MKKPRKKKGIIAAFEKHEKRDEVRDFLSIERDSKIEQKVDDTHKIISSIYDSLPDHIESSVKKVVPDAIRLTVNGKIDKVSGDIGIIQKIFVFVAPIAIGILGWSILWEINTSNQVAAVAQAVEDLTRTK